MLNPVVSVEASNTPSVWWGRFLKRQAKMAAVMAINGDPQINGRDVITKTLHDGVIW